MRIARVDLSRENNEGYAVVDINYFHIENNAYLTPIYRTISFAMSGNDAAKLAAELQLHVLNETEVDFYNLRARA